MNEWSVFIQLDEEQNIVNVNSDAYLEDTSNWIEIDRGEGDKYSLAQGHYFDLPIFEPYTMIPNYKYTNDEIALLTEDEKRQYQEAHKAEDIPSQLDQIEAQITYTAMMTNTLLGE